MDSEDEVTSELTLFKMAGGGTLCDVSPFGVRYNIAYLHISVLLISSGKTFHCMEYVCYQ